MKFKKKTKKTTNQNQEDANLKKEQLSFQVQETHHVRKEQVKQFPMKRRKCQNLVRTNKMRFKIQGKPII